MRRLKARVCSDTCMTVSLRRRSVVLPPPRLHVLLCDAPLITPLRVRVESGALLERQARDQRVESDQVPLVNEVWCRILCQTRDCCESSCILPLNSHAFHPLSTVYQRATDQGSVPSYLGGPLRLNTVVFSETYPGLPVGDFHIPGMYDTAASSVLNFRKRTNG